MSEGPAAFNPHAVGAIGAQGPSGNELNGGRIFGLLNDTQGFMKGTGGFTSGPILNGGVAGIGNSKQGKPGFLASLGFSKDGIMAQLKDATSNANMQAAIQMSSGNVQQASMAELGQYSAAASGAPMPSGGGRGGDFEIG